MKRQWEQYQQKFGRKNCSNCCYFHMLLLAKRVSKSHVSMSSFVVVRVYICCCWWITCEWVNCERSHCDKATTLWVKKGNMFCACMWADWEISSQQRCQYLFNGNDMTWIKVYFTVWYGRCDLCVEAMFCT